MVFMCALPFLENAEIIRKEFGALTPVRPNADLHQFLLLSDALTGKLDEGSYDETSHQKFP